MIARNIWCSGQYGIRSRLCRGDESRAIGFKMRHREGASLYVPFLNLPTKKVATSKFPYRSSEIYCRILFSCWEASLQAALPRVINLQLPTRVAFSNLRLDLAKAWKRVSNSFFIHCFSSFCMFFCIFVLAERTTKETGLRPITPRDRRERPEEGWGGDTGKDRSGVGAQVAHTRAAAKAGSVGWRRFRFAENRLAAVNVSRLLVPRDISGVILGVRTCDIFLCLLPIVSICFIALAVSGLFLSLLLRHSCASQVLTPRMSPFQARYAMGMK